jgi:molybdopterin adenylyltransferase
MSSAYAKGISHKLPHQRLDHPRIGRRPALALGCYDAPVIRAGILTVSDAGSRGEREDTSGAAIRELLAGIGAEVARYEIVPDDAARIAATLRGWCDAGGIDLILSTGGTGLAARDVTPEATLQIAERFAPGIAEAMRAEGMRHTPKAMLSRAVAVVRGRTLIINLPGSEKGVRESLGAVLPVLPHAVELLQGVTEHPGGA